MIDRLNQLAAEVAAAARASGQHIVLAESCTAGLVANVLSRVPGASDWLCGSAVVYRNATKSAWLRIPADRLDDPTIGPVSVETAAAMCTGVLAMTPEATLAVSITGHLGPSAPPELDGLAYLGVLLRARSGDDAGAVAEVAPLRLVRELPADSPCDSLRVHRQHEAAVRVLEGLLAALRACGASSLP